MALKLVNLGPEVCDALSKMIASQTYVLRIENYHDLTIEILEIATPSPHDRALVAFVEASEHPEIAATRFLLANWRQEYGTITVYANRPSIDSA